jgi:Protein of unknown function (DUF1570)
MPIMTPTTPTTDPVTAPLPHLAAGFTPGLASPAATGCLSTSAQRLGDDESCDRRGIAALNAGQARAAKCVAARSLLCILAALVIAGCQPSPRPTTAVEEDPTPQAGVLPIRMSEVEWEFEGTQGTLILTDHYRLRTTETRPFLLERLPGFLEASLARYSHAITDLPTPRRRMDSYLFANRGEWKRFTSRFLGARAPLYMQIPRGGYSINGTAVLWQIGPKDTFAIAAHEGWHQYNQTTFRTPLPMWLDEGMATYMEGYKFAGSEAVFKPWANTERFNELRDAEAAGDLLSLATLIGSSPIERMQRPDGGELTYYAQAWALVHFLLEGDAGSHRPSLEQLLRDAAAGRVHEHLAAVLGPRAAVLATRQDRDAAVFQAYFGSDVEALDQAYRRFVRKVVAPGSRGRIVEGRSPLRDE